MIIFVTEKSNQLKEYLEHLRKRTICQASIGDIRYRPELAKWDDYHSEPRYVLSRVARTMSQVLMSRNASMTCSFLSRLFSVPLCSSRIRSIAAIRSSLVNIIAFAGESGMNRRTATPTARANAPSSR